MKDSSINENIACKKHKAMFIIFEELNERGDVGQAIQICDLTPWKHIGWEIFVLKGLQIKLPQYPFQCAFATSLSFCAKHVMAT